MLCNNLQCSEAIPKYSEDRRSAEHAALQEGLHRLEHHDGPIHPPLLAELCRLFSGKHHDQSIR